MKHVVLSPGADLDGFRSALRQLVAAGTPPGSVSWESMPGLFPVDAAAEAPPVMLSRRVAEIVRLVVCHTDPERYALLYKFVWRILQGEMSLPDIASDMLVHRLNGMEKSVRRDLHKMHAFVRFRKVEAPDGDHFVAWFEPEHFIVQATAQFFVDRFASMRWSILTPKGVLHWDCNRLISGPPARRADAPGSDIFETGWRAYYESIFNPARINPEVMRSHMAKKYWKNLPETRAIPELVRSAPLRVKQMIEQEKAMPRKRDPQKAVAAMRGADPQSLDALNRLIRSSPPMVLGGTRAVLGEGLLHPDIAFVGEQPGDQEDLQGKPFVGPAGKLLNRAMEEAGIERKETYVTNAVKHFKFEQRGKRRMHSKPNAGEVKHYRWWLEKELDFVRPRLVVALGATAALALAGKPLSVSANRGPQILGGRAAFITIHPSFLLRMPDADRAAAWKSFVADLKRARKMAESRDAA